MPGDTDSTNLHERAQQRGNVIDLQGHHAARQALDAILEADERHPGYEHLLAQAVSLGPPILAAVVRRLDSSRPRRLAALGRLVVEYPYRVQVVQTLLRAVADRRNSDNRRMGAMLVLNQYLGVPPAEDFLSSLHNPAQTAVHSLISTLNDCSDQPEMLLGYFRALSALPVEVLYAMLSTLAEFEGEAAVAALRLLALQPDPDLMHAAIEALISRQDAQALRALAVLEPNLPPEAAHAVSRHLHKLRLSGHRARPLQMANGKCRALVGPIDGRGRRLMWFTVPGDSMPDALGYLALLLKDSVGVLDAMGAPAQESDAFPRPAPVGTLHTLETPLPGQSPDLLPHNGTAWCLEAPFDYGLSVLRKGVEENWLSGTPLPLEYQLLFDMVWQYGAGFEEEASFMDRLPDNEEAVENENDLLSDGLFDDWYLESGAVYLAAQELLAEDIGLPIEMTDQSWRALLPMVIKLARSEFGADMRRCYSERLESMAEWLFVAGQEESARLAASAARTMLVSPPEANLFVLTLVQKGLLMALANLMSGSELRI